jgi:hypothetical protein
MDDISPLSRMSVFLHACSPLRLTCRCHVAPSNNDVVYKETIQIIVFLSLIGMFIARNIFFVPSNATII